MVSEQAAVGQSLMAPKRTIRLISRQQGIETSVFINHQGVIVETVLVIVHITTVKKERALLGVGYEVVPRSLVVRRVSLDFKRHHA